MKRQTFKNIFKVLCIVLAISCFAGCGVVSTKNPKTALADAYAEIANSDNYSVDMVFTGDLGEEFNVILGGDKDGVTMHLKQKIDNKKQFIDASFTGLASYLLYTEVQGTQIYTYSSPGNNKWAKKGVAIKDLTSIGEDLLKNIGTDFYDEVFDGSRFSYVKDTQSYALNTEFSFSQLAALLQNLLSGICDSVVMTVTELDYSTTSSTSFVFDGKMNVALRVMGDPYKSSCTVKIKFFNIGKTTVTLPPTK